MEKLTVGFDLGGTKMLCALVDGTGTIVARTKRKTRGAEGPQVITEDIIASIREVLDMAQRTPLDLEAIGLAVPGLLDRAKGRVVHTPNLGFENFPLAEKIKKEFPVPVFLENDVNAGVWGEYVAGAAKGCDSVLGVFPGTGIGGGLVIGGRLHRGATGNAGEFGHMTIQLEGPSCGCGQRGHVEGMASRSAMSREAAGLIAAGAVTGPLAEYGSNVKDLSSKFFAEALKLKEPKIMEIIDRSAEHLGTALAGAVNLLDPELVVLGGGLVEKLGDYYIKKVEKALKDRAMAFIVKTTKIKSAVLGDDAGVLGAAFLAQDYARKEQ